MIEFGENILLHAELKNWGNGDALNTNATLLTDDEFVSISDDNQDYGTIPAQDSVMQMDAFQFIVADYIPDMHIVPFNLSIQDETRELWSSSFSVTLFAPAYGNRKPGHCAILTVEMAISASMPVKPSI